ncbi:MAG: hypothetical protein O2887_18010 [Bacteroidetes bacterium]|nr:hypothetical protein [Bacteroidota bacterium]MDA1122351.1 hypothetical protein [Bacteroidota bacterium]
MSKELPNKEREIHQLKQEVHNLKQIIAEGSYRSSPMILENQALEKEVNELKKQVTDLVIALSALSPKETDKELLIELFEIVSTKEAQIAEKIGKLMVPRLQQIEKEHAELKQKEQKHQDVVTGKRKERKMGKSNVQGFINDYVKKHPEKLEAFVSGELDECNFQIEIENSFRKFLDDPDYILIDRTWSRWRKKIVHKNK